MDEVAKYGNGLNYKGLFNIFETIEAILRQDRNYWAICKILPKYEERKIPKYPCPYE